MLLIRSPITTRKPIAKIPQILATRATTKRTPTSLRPSLKQPPKPNSNALFLTHNRHSSHIPALKILLPGRRDSTSKDRAPHLHIDNIKRVHDGLDPDLVDVGEELTDGLLGGRGGRVGADGGRATRAGCARGGVGGWVGRVQEKELNVF